MKPSALRLSLPWLLLALAGLIWAALRYGLVAPRELADLCALGTGPAWCGLRQLVVEGFISYGYGYAALAATAAALLWRRPLLAWIAAVLGLLALELFCYYAGAAALLLGSLRLVQLQTMAGNGTPPAAQYRQSNRHVQPQP